MENNQAIRIKNEESILRKGQRDYLIFPNEYLVPARIEEYDDAFDLELDTNRLSPYTDIMNCDDLAKYRLLIACSKLRRLRIDYSFTITPENLMYDVNFMPKVRQRDGSNGNANDDFVNEYKALIGSTLSSKYSFKDFYEGGSDLYDKDKVLVQISQLEDVNDIVAVLDEEYSALAEKMGKDQMIVSSSKYKRTKRSIPIMIIVIVLMAAALCWLFFFNIPSKDIQIKVSDDYLAQEYIKVLDTLAEEDMSKMTTEVRYMAAISGVHTASLNDKQKQKVLEGISLKSDTLLLEYWIDIGRGNYANAVDIARRIGDEELELYGLIIEKDAIELNTSIKGSRKAEKITSIEEQITSLEEKLTSTDEDGGQDSE